VSLGIGEEVLSVDQSVVSGGLGRGYPEVNSSEEALPLADVHDEAARWCRCRVFFISHIWDVVLSVGLCKQFAVLILVCVLKLRRILFVY